MHGNDYDGHGQHPQQQQQQTVLIVDDEPIVREVVERYLRQEGYRVESAVDGPDALRRFAAARPDLVLLDLMLPGIDGLEVCRQLRAQSNVPIIMLTAKGDETDTIIGLGVGADDYVAKPFSPRELVARAKAVLRRAGTPPPVAEGDALRFGRLTIRPDRRGVEIDGGAVELTAREFDLLWYFARNPGRVLTREQLLERVWGYDFAGTTRTVDVHVRWLREKIEDDPAKPRYLRTSRGAGYLFDHTPRSE